MAHTTVGIKELKARLSDYLRQVKSGTAVTITERGRPVGRIVPTRPPVDVQARLKELERTGLVAWSGHKLKSSIGAPRVRGKSTISDLIIENRE